MENENFVRDEVFITSVAQAVADRYHAMSVRRGDAEPIEDWAHCSENERAALIENIRPRVQRLLSEYGNRLFDGSVPVEQLADTLHRFTYEKLQEGLPGSFKKSYDEVKALPEDSGERHYIFADYEKCEMYAEVAREVGMKAFRTETLSDDLEAAIMQKGAPATIDGLLDGKGEVYGLPFDKAVGYYNDIMGQLSSAIGWKSDRKLYDFEGFSGYYLSYDETDRNIDLCYQGEVQAYFYPKADGSLGITVSEESTLGYPEDVNPWLVITDLMNGKFVLEPGNVEAARYECHYGNELVYGIKYGDAVAFAYDGSDVNLNRQLVEREGNIRFVSQDVLSDAMLNHLDFLDKNPGFEGDKKMQIIYYAYDGKTVRSESEMAEVLDSVVYREDGGESIARRNEYDWQLIRTVNERLDGVRRQLEHLAGIPEGSPHFRFTNAVYPLSFREDIFSLVSGSVTNQLLNCSCLKGSIVSVVPEGNRFNFREGERKISPAEFVESVSKTVLSLQNVKAAKRDFRLYLAEMQERAQSRGRGRK